MHAAAMKPSYLSKDELPQDSIDQALAESKEQALAKVRDDMPEKARENMMKGVAAKAVRELEKRDVLMEQDLAMSDESMSVAKYLEQEGKRLGKEIKVKEWALFAIK